MDESLQCFGISESSGLEMFINGERNRETKNIETNIDP